jgi:hypothetical protein
MHVPALMNVTVEPETRQINCVAVVKVTGLPEPPPVADTLYGDPFTIGRAGGSEVKVIACTPGPT